MSIKLCLINLQSRVGIPAPPFSIAFFVAATLLSTFFFSYLHPTVVELPLPFHCISHCVSVHEHNQLCLVDSSPNSSPNLFCGLFAVFVESAPYKLRLMQEKALFSLLCFLILSGCPLNGRD